MVDPADIEPDYYLTHFETLLDLVEAHDLHLLEAQEVERITAFRGLTRGARMLVVRLLQRRHRAVLRSGLRYPEIGDIDAALDELQQESLVAVGHEVAELLGPRPCADRFTVPQLRQVARTQGLSPGGKKAELAERVAGSPQATAALASVDSLVCLRDHALFERLLVLFFGNRWQDLSTFVVELLEHAQYPRYEVSRSPPLFDGRPSLESYFSWTDRLESDLDGMQTEDLCSALDRALEEIRDDAAPAPHRWQVAAHVLRTNFGFEAARELERRGETHRALAAYRRIATHAHDAHVVSKAVDRLGLLGRRMGDVAPFQSVRPRAESLALDAVSRHRIATRAHRLGLCPDPNSNLHTAAVIDLELPRRPSPGARPLYGTQGEGDTIEVATLHALGGCGLGSENGLIQTITALALWDVIFAPVPGAFIQPFQSAPLDFASPRFAASRETFLRGRLADVRETSLRDGVLCAWDAQQGAACRWIRWSVWSRDEISCAASALGQRFVDVLDWIALHPVRHGRGFPDLLLWDHDDPTDSARFVEVKGPGDQIRIEQRIAHDVLIRAGYCVEVARVTQADAG